MHPRMALIGRGISHSKSKSIYEKLLKTQVDYTLLEYKNSSDIPDLISLLQIYPRISITAPYKNDVYKRIDEFPNNTLNLKSVNAIRLIDEKVVGINTDLLAFEKIFNVKFKNFKNIIVLGDGNMSGMIQKYLDSLSLAYKVCSRKTDQFGGIDDFLDQKTLFINSCGREYNFEYEIGSNSCFWDMNYNHEFHLKHFGQENSTYLDGVSLLEEQARFALSFWN